MRRLLLPILLLLALVVPGAALAADPTPTLTVVGQGSAMVTPDTADVGASVTKTATTAAAAREDVAKRTNALLATLDRLGIARADIQTTSISITRQTFKKRPRVRFTAAASISVHLTNVTLVGPVFDALTAAHADDVNGPSFGFSNPSAGRAEAEQAALADARSRADAAAAAVGMRVIGVQSINLDPGVTVTPLNGSVDVAAGSAPSAKATPTPVETGRQTISASVAVVFLIASA